MQRQVLSGAGTLLVTAWPVNVARTPPSSASPVPSVSADRYCITVRNGRAGCRQVDLSRVFVKSSCTERLVGFAVNLVFEFSLFARSGWPSPW